MFEPSIQRHCHNGASGCELLIVCLGETLVAVSKALREREEALEVIEQEEGSCSKERAAVERSIGGAGIVLVF